MTRLVRSVGLVVTFLAALLATGVKTASAAPEWRYGTVSWKKDTVNSTADTYVVNVKYTTAWRWGSISSLTSLPGGSFCLSPDAGVLNGVTPDSCPPIGNLIRSVGPITPDKPVIFDSAATPAASIQMTSRVVQVLFEVDPLQQIAVTEFSFTMTFPASANPVRLTYTAPAGARLFLPVQENNSNTAPTLTTVIDAAPPVTRSPVVESLPVQHLTVGVPTTLSLPNLTADGLSNMFRFATASESLLTTRVPGSTSGNLADALQLDALTGVAMVARAPPGRELHSRSCLAQISSTSAWLRRACTRLRALSADIRDH